MKINFSALLALASPVFAQLVPVSDFGDNPSNALMYTYVPSNLRQSPAILVILHHCQGTAQSMYQSTPYASFADQSGDFLLIYGQSPYDGTCWDISSSETLQRDGGANSNAIANMIKWAIGEYEADSSRVYLMGASSGAMMANVMAATYPDLFNAIAVYSGVPHSCFFTGTVNGWNSECSGGRINKTPEEWAQDVHDSYPGYEGGRPRMRIYHGTGDDILATANFQETIDQWSGIFGYDPESPESEQQDTPTQGATTFVYGESLEGVLVQGVGHGVPNFGAADMAFFGL